MVSKRRITIGQFARESSHIREARGTQCTLETSAAL